MELQAVDECESKGGKCWIYGYNGFKVWNGPVTVRQSRKSVGSYTDEDVCQFSIDHSGQALKWDTTNPSKFLDEAKRRGLTLDACSKYKATGAATTTTSAPNKKSIEKRLRELKKFVDEGLVTPDEAAEKRKEIIKGI